MKQKTTRTAKTAIATVVITMLAMSTTGLVTPVHAALTKCTTSSSSPFFICTVQGKTPGVCLDSLSACNPTTGGHTTTHKAAAGLRSGINQECQQGVLTGCTTTKFSSVH